MSIIRAAKALPQRILGWAISQFNASYAGAEGAWAIPYISAYAVYAPDEDGNFGPVLDDDGNQVYAEFASIQYVAKFMVDMLTSPNAEVAKMALGIANAAGVSQEELEQSLQTFRNDVVIPGLAGKQNASGNLTKLSGASLDPRGMIYVDENGGIATQLTQVFGRSLLSLERSIDARGVLSVPSIAEMQAAIASAIAELVNGSPALLDTLGEFATALGNDPNFATTIMNALGGKQPSSAILTGLAAIAYPDGSIPYSVGGSSTFGALATAALGRSLLGAANRADLGALEGNYARTLTRGTALALAANTDAPLIMSASAAMPPYADATMVAINAGYTIASAATVAGTYDLTLKMTSSASSDLLIKIVIRNPGNNAIVDSYTLRQTLPAADTYAVRLPLLVTGALAAGQRIEIVLNSPVAVNMTNLRLSVVAKLG